LILNKNDGEIDVSKSLLNKSFLKCFITKKHSLKTLLYRFNSTKFKTLRRVKKNLRKHKKVKTRYKRLRARFILQREKRLSFILERTSKVKKLIDKGIIKKSSFPIKNRAYYSIKKILRRWLRSKVRNKIRRNFKKQKKEKPVLSVTPKVRVGVVDKKVNTLKYPRNKNQKKKSPLYRYFRDGRRQRLLCYLRRGKKKWIKLSRFPKKGHKVVKWFFLRKIRRKRRYRRTIINYAKLIFKKRRWFKLKNSSRFSLAFMKSIFKFHDNSTSLKFYKTQKKVYQDPIQKLIMKPLVKLEVLLWKAGFFSSVRNIRQELRKKNILVNGKIVTTSVILKRGDIVKVLSKGLIFNSDVAKKGFLSSFCEVDPYTRTIILLRSAQNFREEDFSFILRERINERLLVRYLKRN